MSVKLIYERPDIHREYSAVKNITMELDGERNLDEMQEAFDEFLKAMGYNVPYRDEEDDQPLVFGDYKASDNVLDTPPIVFDEASENIMDFSAGGGMASDIIDLYDPGDGITFSDTITLNLDETYGTTTTKLKDD